MAASAVSAGATAFQSGAATQVGMSHCVCTDLTSPTSAQGEGGTPWAGTSGANNSAPGASLLVNHIISRRYRGGKPRTYLPFGSGAEINASGLWSSSYVSAIQTAWATFVSDLLAAGAGCTLTALVNVSYYQGFTVVTSPTTHRARNVPTLRSSPVIDTINSSVVSNVIGSQRRRNRDA